MTTHREQQTPGNSHDRTGERSTGHVGTPRNAPGPKGLLLVISGPSGVGKTTIVRRVLDALGGSFSVSATTRPKRPSETHGVDYFFLTADEFEQKRKDNDFLEFAEVFGSHWYGTPRESVTDMLREGKLVVLDIDVQGALQVREHMPDAYMMFIEPPDPEALLERLRGRGSEDESTIQRRFDEAKREIETARKSNAYDMFLVNDALDDAVTRACRAIQHQRGLTWTDIASS